MARYLLLVLVVMTVDSATLVAQSRDTVPRGHRGTSVLFEAAIGVRLDPRPDPADDTRWYASWEFGPSFNRGHWAWGATIFAGVDVDGARWGIRPRYRRWLGSKAALDLGAGILLGGNNQGYGEEHYPGFAGLIGLSYGNWLGLNLELQAVRTTRISRDYYLPSQAVNVPGVVSESTDWAWYIGPRLSGLGAIPLLAAEAILFVAAAAAVSGSW